MTFVINEQRVLLRDVSKEITTEQLGEIKYLLKPNIPAGELEKLDDVLKLFDYLTKEDGIAGTKFISNLLQRIGRKDLSNRIRPERNPSFREAFNLDSYIERKESCKILQLCNPKNETAIILVIGGIAVGKTELIKYIFHETEQKEKWFIESSEGETFTDIINQIKDKIGCSTHNQLSHHQIVSELCRCKEPALLVLDISKTAHSPDFLKNLWIFLKQVLAKNAELKIIVSARYEYDCMTVMKSLQKVHVQCPNREFAHKLLEQNGLVITMDGDRMDELIECCQGEPWILEKYCRLVAQNNIPQGIKSLSIIQSDLKADAAFRTQFEIYTPSVKDQIIKLSAIPGVFPCCVASFILNVNDIDCATTITEILSAKQLLQKSGSEYFMPCAIRECIKQLCNENQQMKETLDHAIDKVVQCYLDILYALNGKFMVLENCPSNQVSRDLFFGVEEKCDCLQRDTITCNCSAARKTLFLFKKYKMSFLWVLQPRIRTKQWRDITDCANECVSFFAKPLSYEQKREIYDGALEQSTKFKDHIRRACTLVSIVFLRMYHYGCQSNYPYFFTTLTEADGVLRRNIANQCDLKVEISETWAHCLSKLGHTIGANDKENLKTGLEMLDTALDIRKKEISHGRGSKALIAATYVDIGNIYKHNGNYIDAMKYCKDALEIYKECLGEHPFTASTLSFVAELHEHNNNLQLSNQHWFIAKQLSEKLLGAHLDTARFTRGIARLKLLKNQLDDVCCHLKATFSMRRYFGYNERIDCIEMFKGFCDPKETEELNKEALEMKKKSCLERQRDREADGNHGNFLILNEDGSFKKAVKYVSEKIRNNKSIFLIPYTLLIFWTGSKVYSVAWHENANSTACQPYSW